MSDSDATVAAEKADAKKVVPPPTKEEIQELQEDYVVLCTKIPWEYKRKGATYLLRCNLCEQYLRIVLGAKGHIEGKKHFENKIFKKVEEGLKLVGSPNKEQLDAITVKLQQVYDEWSAEACGQQSVREKIVSDFQEFVQRIKGCENVTVELFGSTYTGYALKDSDINMNLRFSDQTNSSSYYSVINAVVEHLTAMANSSEDDVVYTDLNNHLYSAVSHITFTHRPSGLSCHVRYGSYHKASISTSKLLRRYGEVDPRVRVLAVVLKYWAKLCQLDIQELGSYPSQMFVLMLVHFLQQRSPPVLPVPPKPNDFSDTQQCLEHFDEYLSGLDHMIKTWRITNTESLGMLWLGMFRFYMEETLEHNVIQVTEKAPVLKENTTWSTYKLSIVLSPVSPFCNFAKASSSRKMYAYLEACFKATLVYFGKAFVSKTSTTLPDKGHSKPLDTTSHDHCINGKNVSTVIKPSEHVAYPTDVASQLSSFEIADEQDGPEDCLSDSDILNQTPRSCDTTTRSCDLDCNTSDTSHHDDSLSTSDMETSCEHNNTQLDDNVVVEDVEDAKGFQYQFASSNFATKALPDVCSLCKQEGHTLTSPKCFFTKKAEKKMLVAYPPLALKQLKELERVLVELKERKCLRPADRKLRKDICDIIEHHVKVIYPDAKLKLFGSSANEFGSRSSDIDISMRLPGHFDHDNNAEVIKRVAHHLMTTTAQQDWSVDNIQTIATARVPLVKMTLTEKWNDLECDISLGNYLALHNTELLATYANIDKRVQVLGYVLKEFAKSSEMCDASSGSLSSYAYIILLLHYLQQVIPPVIPVLQQIGKGGSVDVDGWNCWFYQFSKLSQLEKIWPHVGENKSTIGELLINFFKYYLMEFDWQKNVVCIRQLEPLNKIEKEWAPKQVCIEDPFNHDHNLSSHLTNNSLVVLCSVEIHTQCFEHAHNHITNPHLYRQPLTIADVLDVGLVETVPQDGLCYTCGKRGHGRYNCPNGRFIVTCNLCGKQGHVTSKCPSNQQGYSTRHSSPFLVHPSTPPYNTLQSRVPYAASKHPVYRSGVPEYGHNKKKTAAPKQDTPANTRPATVTSSPSHGRQLPTNATSQRSHFPSRPARDVMSSVEPDSPRRKGNHRGGSNRGRASRNMSDAYHQRNKQRYQQDSWPHTK